MGLGSATRTVSARRGARMRKSPASPEEGAALIRAFLEIESAEVRDFIVNLAISLSNVLTHGAGSGGRMGRNMH